MWPSDRTGHHCPLANVFLWQLPFWASASSSWKGSGHVKRKEHDGVTVLSQGLFGSAVVGKVVPWPILGGEELGQIGRGHTSREQRFAHAPRGSGVGRLRKPGTTTTTTTTTPPTAGAHASLGGGSFLRGGFGAAGRQ